MKTLVIIITLVSVAILAWMTGALLGQLHLNASWLNVKLPLALFTGLTMGGFAGYFQCVKEYA